MIVEIDTVLLVSYGQGTDGSPWKDFVGIKGVQSYTNFFIGVQGEPGRGKYFDLV